MTCPLCGARKGRRQCPALGQSICSTCCGTKRLHEIRCPSNCVYLTAAREHPSAQLMRQQQEDMALLAHATRDLSHSQSRLFVAINAFFARYQPPDIHTVIDQDVAEAAAALASTFETAARGVIYEHRPTSRQAERLTSGLKAVLDETDPNGGTALQRDAALVLRRIEEAIGARHAAHPGEPRDYLEVLGRIFSSHRDAATPDAARPGSRLIVP